MISQMIKATSEAMAAANIAAAAAAHLQSSKAASSGAAPTEQPAEVANTHAPAPTPAAEAQTFLLPMKQQQKIPAPLEKLLDQAGQKFEKEVRKYLKAVNRAKKAHEGIAAFRATDKMDRYPTGVRPFRSPEEQETLDETWSDASKNEVE